MFTAICLYQDGPDGIAFAPDDDASDFACELRVTFEPWGYHAAEPDVGAGPSYDSMVVAIELRDLECPIWRDLPRGGHNYRLAKLFLEEHFRDEMWAQADAEAKDYFSEGW